MQQMRFSVNLVFRISIYRQLQTEQLPGDQDLLASLRLLQEVFFLVVCFMEFIYVYKDSKMDYILYSMPLTFPSC